MTHRQPGRLLGPGALLPAVLLLVVGTALPASASCGDYVHIRPAGQSADAGHAAQPAVPCQGPHCHQAPDRPLPAPPSTAPVTPADQALLAIEPATELGAGRRVIGDSLAVPRAIQIAIFHPPRV